MATSNYHANYGPSKYHAIVTITNAITSHRTEYKRRAKIVTLANTSQLVSGYPQPMWLARPLASPLVYRTTLPLALVQRATERSTDHSHMWEYSVVGTKVAVRGRPLHKNTRFSQNNFSNGSPTII